MSKYDVIIVGAGIVGLASGLKLIEKNPYLKILFLEKENAVSKHQTGNNSGVIHSGIYYKPGSMKAANCIRGYKMLIDFCRKNEINYKVCGKIILATGESEIPVMKNIYERGVQNGLEDLKILNGEELRRIEPNAGGVAAIWVPQTGVINYTEVSKKYLEYSLSANAQILYNQHVQNISVSSEKCEVITEDKTFETKLVVTCSGLFSDRVAKLTNKNIEFRLIPFRGEYYKIKPEAQSVVRGLIYPVPDPAFPFLGVHFTRMIDDKVECGPNAVLAFKREGYDKTSFNIKDTLDTFGWSGFRVLMKNHWKTGLGEFYRSYSKHAFVKALRKLVPTINAADLVTGGSGVRAQACFKDGKLLDDFYILEEKRVIHVCNAPSPAATASLSIGDYISSRIIDRLG